MEIEWKLLTAYPIEKGVSAPFTGIHNNILIVAGGCNFPDIPVAEGGKKKFYSEIYVADTEKFEWEEAFNLPYTVAYGVSVSTDKGVVCIGGQNSDSLLTKVTLIAWDVDAQKTTLTQWADLPATIDNAAATVANNKIYVLGGNVNGKPSSAVYYIDIEQPNEGWRECAPFIGANRVQPVAFSLGDKIYVAGGFQPAINGQEPIVSTDILEYDIKQDEWKQVTSFPIDGKNTPYCFVGGNAVAYDSSAALFLCGVNYNRFLPAIQREMRMQQAVATNNDTLITELKNQSKEYLTQPVDWYNFNTALLLWDSAKNQWNDLGNFSQLARAGAGVVLHQNKLYVVCGELKPGIRTSEVNCMVIK